MAWEQRPETPLIEGTTVHVDLSDIRDERDAFVAVTREVGPWLDGLARRGLEVVGGWTMAVRRDADYLDGRQEVHVSVAVVPVPSPYDQEGLPGVWEGDQA